MYSYRLPALATGLLLTGAALAQDAATAAPTVDELVDAYVENTGGAEAWADLTTMTSDATMAMGPMEFAAKVTSARPNKQHIDVDVQGQRLVMAYDGETAWQINPFAGATTPQPMSEQEAEQFTNQTFEPALFDYAAKGHTAELVGTKEVEGTETYEVKLTKADGNVEYYYFDTEYMVPIMQATPVTSGPAEGQLAETYLSDYQEVEGLTMPMFMETKVNGATLQKLTLSNVVLNPEVEDSLFALPEGAAAPAEADEPVDAGDAPDAPAEDTDDESPDGGR